MSVEPKEYQPFSIVTERVVIFKRILLVFNFLIKRFFSGNLFEKPLLLGVDMREKQIEEVLHGLVAASAAMEGAALVTSDGLLISSSLPSHMDEDKISAMVAALLSLSERAVEELDKGSPEQVTVKGSKGYIVLTSAGEEAVLAVITNLSAKLGLVYLDVKNAARKLQEVLAS